MKWMAVPRQEFPHAKRARACAIEPMTTTASQIACNQANRRWIMPAVNVSAQPGVESDEAASSCLRSSLAPRRASPTRKRPRAGAPPIMLPSAGKLPGAGATDQRLPTVRQQRLKVRR